MWCSFYNALEYRYDAFSIILNFFIKGKPYVELMVNYWEHFLHEPSSLLVPYRLAGGTLSLLAVCLSVSQSVSPSVRLSVRHTSVFRTFLCCLLRYWLEIYHMNLSWHNTDQVRVWLRLTQFYRSYCPLLKFSFPDFSLQSFEILTWNLVYECVMT